MKSWWVLLKTSISTLAPTTTWSSMKQGCLTLETTPAWPATLLLEDVAPQQQSLCLVWKHVLNVIITQIRHWLIFSTLDSKRFFSLWLSSVSSIIHSWFYPLRNKTSDYLYGWVTKSFTTSLYRNTDLFWNKTCSCVYKQVIKLFTKTI